MKRILVAVILILAATGAFAGSVEAGHHTHLAALLNLSQDQGIAWETAEKEFKAAVAPLIDQQSALRSQLDTMYAAGDACAIGSQALQIHSVGVQIRNAHRGLEQKIESILTPDQKEKYNALHQAEEMHGRHERSMQEQ